MNPNEISEITASNLLALRTRPDALRAITDRLKVTEMGPADHIRTKHEVKAFIESAADLKAAEAIVERARTRRVQESQNATMRLSPRHSRNVSL